MAALALRGQHRMPIRDLMLAAIAQSHSAVVLHYDADYERIADVTGQPHEWIIPAGPVMGATRPCSSTGAGATAVAWVVKRADGGQLTEADIQRVQRLAGELGGAGIERVAAAQTAPQAVSPNRSVQLVTVALQGTPQGRGRGRGPAPGARALHRGA
jgi:hypothetical protein